MNDSALASLIINSFNGNGLADERKLIAVLSKFKDSKNNIILFQETDATPIRHLSISSKVSPVPSIVPSFAGVWG